MSIKGKKAQQLIKDSLGEFLTKTQGIFTPDAELPTPPEGYRLLSEGEIIPSSYIWHNPISDIWSFNPNSKIAGNKADKKHNPPIAVSITQELSEKLILISAELKRDILQSVTDLNEMDAEDLASIFLQIVLCGDIQKAGKVYVPFSHANTMTERIIQLQKEVEDLKKNKTEQSSQCKQPEILASGAYFSNY